MSTANSVIFQLLGSNAWVFVSLCVFLLLQNFNSLLQIEFSIIEAIYFLSINKDDSLNLSILLLCNFHAFESAVFIEVFIKNIRSSMLARTVEKGNHGGCEEMSLICHQSMHISAYLHYCKVDTDTHGCWICSFLMLRFTLLKKVCMKWNLFFFSVIFL